VSWKDVGPTNSVEDSQQAPSLALIVELDQSSFANNTGTTDSKLASSDSCCRIEWFFPLRCRRGNCRTTMHQRSHTERHVNFNVFCSNSGEIQLNLTQMQRNRDAMIVHTNDFHDLGHLTIHRNQHARSRSQCH
jgi:hypothetical protein